MGPQRRCGTMPRMFAEARTRIRRVPFAGLKVGDVMHPGIVSCAPETPLPDVAALMVIHGMHAVFVFDQEDPRGETGVYMGIVSDLDLVAAAWAGLETRTA